MNAAPIIVHACHCSWCKRETGTAFAHNALVETKNVELLSGEVERETIPSESGKGQEIIRCPDCKIALWGHYAAGGPTMAFVRVGTLDEPSALPPDIHVYAASKADWVRLPDDARVFQQFYNPLEEWPPESLARARAARSG
jgi:hypothetical protein